MGITVRVEKIQWYEPRWFFVPRLWGQLRHIQNPGTILSIFATSLLICGAIVVILKVWIPQIIIPNNIWLVVLVFPGILLNLYFHFLLQTLFHPKITVTIKSITITRLNSIINICDFEILFLTLTVHSTDRIRLKIRYSRKKLEQTRVLGVSPKIDLAKLIQLLPKEPIVHDARFRKTGVERRN